MAETWVPPKRERIIQELLRRIRTVLPDINPQRGRYGEEVTTYPSIYVYEGIESSTGKNTRGMYTRTLPVAISYFIKGEGDLLYTWAVDALAQLGRGIEMDERFVPEGRREGLVIRYSLDESVGLVYDDGVVDIEMVYVFEYTEDAPWVQRPFTP